MDQKRKTYFKRSRQTIIKNFLNKLFFLYEEIISLGGINFMPVKKNDNKKTASVEVRDSALIPKKEESGKRRPIRDSNLQPHTKD